MGSEQIIVGECVAELAKLPPSAVDMIFADPPYNLQLGGDLLRPDNSKVDAVDDDWDQFDDFAAYDRFTRAWLTAARRVLKPTGTLWVIGSYHNIFRVGTALQDLGFWMLNDVDLAQDQPDAEFSRHALHQRARDADLVRARAQAEALHLQLRRDEGAQRRPADALGLGAADLPGAERLHEGDGRKVHPTQKPEALLYRVLLATTNRGDMVLDPFFGSRHHRRSGQEAWPPLHRHRTRDQDYAAIAPHRIDAGRSPARRGQLARHPSKRDEPRIPFGVVVESGMLMPGSLLSDDARRFRAKVRADGTHRLQRPLRRSTAARSTRSAPPCKGHRPATAGPSGISTPRASCCRIDTLRQQIRARMN